MSIYIYIHTYMYICTYTYCPATTTIIHVLSLLLIIVGVASSFCISVLIIFIVIVSSGVRHFSAGGRHLLHQRHQLQNPLSGAFATRCLHWHYTSDRGDAFVPAEDVLAGNIGSNKKMKFLGSMIAFS